MEVSTRKSVFDDLNKYCHLADKNDFIEVTEWTNGEGYDISFKNKIISLTEGEIEAIYHLMKTLRYA